MFKPAFLTTCLLMMAIPAAQAAVSPEEAARLGKDLTPLGAERAANADGSIPEWNGCPDLKKVPMAQLQSGDRRWDPYAAEKPLYRVSAANMAQYDALLSEGVKAVLTQYPDLYLDVYPTHRNHCAPQWVYDGTKANATRATLEVKGNNDGLLGAINGIPFPIPNTGSEVRWNTNLRWRGQSFESKTRQYSFTTNGERVLGSQGFQLDQMEGYRQGISLEDHAKQGYLSWMFLQFTDAPSFRAGEGLVSRDTDNYVQSDRKVSQYLVGQRRVRRSPNAGWDTPDFVNSGANFFDEVFGSPYTGDERYEYTIVGKQEALIPYSNNKIFSLDEDGVFDKEHHKPDALRWEKHRVWVVEATLKPGQRHAVNKRKFYIDEDTWGTALMDGWDPSGKLWRVSINVPFYLPDVPAQVYYGDVLYVLDASWSARNMVYHDTGYQLKSVEMKPESDFSPSALLVRGVR
ncbi:DUF1329 domain-containing protein [Candidatus Thalassolituus haligoni]|uniref:DUF1329 domain-containing protein n=1 Tax=Candidatus Thalassolituus haligoni TaxID=3100113 RepID=UPI003518934A